MNLVIINGLGALLSSALLFHTSASANEYLNNPSPVVSLKDYPQFSVVGELQRDELAFDGKTAQHFGTAVIVSPCYIITNFHVAFGNDPAPFPGKDYTAIFRAGEGKEPNSFAGHSSATPVLWGDSGANDWAIMHLEKCVGTMLEYGWVEPTRWLKKGIIHYKLHVAAVGYSYKIKNRAALSLGKGQIMGRDMSTGGMKTNASWARKESGGAVFVNDDGILKLCGLITWESRVGKEDEFKEWNDARTNVALDTFSAFFRTDVRELLRRDKENWTPGNPAAGRQRDLSNLSFLENGQPATSRLSDDEYMGFTP